MWYVRQEVWCVGDVWICRGGGGERVYTYIVDTHVLKRVKFKIDGVSVGGVDVGVWFGDMTQRHMTTQ